MVITNKYNLPQSVVDLVKDDEREVDWNSYSVTEIMNTTRSIILNRRHNKEIKQDVSEMTNLIFGTAVHNLIEKHDKTGMAELSFKYELLGKTLKGRCDLYDEKNFKIVDYKTATVTKVLKKDFIEYDMQGLMYAWLAIQNKKLVTNYEFILFLKDWSAREKRTYEMKGEYYPESAVYVYKVDIDTAKLNQASYFIYDKISELIESEKLSDDELLDCGKEATWYTGDKYAVYKKEGDARAQRVFDTVEEATMFMEAKGFSFMQHRKGEYRRCQDYCSCCKFCKYYEERKAK